MFVLLVRFIHILLILFVIFTPFLTQNIPILVLHIITVINLLVHWGSNNDVCSLSILESMLTGKEYNQTFIGRIMSTIYTIDNRTLSTLSYLVSIASMAYSTTLIYKQMT